MPAQESPALIWAGVAPSPSLGTCANCRDFLSELCIAASPGVLEASVRGGSPCLLCFGCAGEISIQYAPVRAALRRAQLRNRLNLPTHGS